jgi:hypothetical protein
MLVLLLSQMGLQALLWLAEGIQGQLLTPRNLLLLQLGRSHEVFSAPEILMEAQAW